MATPNSSPSQTEKYNTPQSPSNHIQRQTIPRNISKASTMLTPSSSPSQTTTKEYTTKFHFIKAYALYCGTPSLTFNQDHRDMKAFVKSIYQSETPAERQREIDRRMWEKYVKDDAFPWAKPVEEKEPDLPPSGMFTPPSPCYFPSTAASNGD